MENKRAIRITRQRQLILDVLRHSRSHPTADEIYEAVRRRLPRISLGTVYRNLDFLAEHGLIKKLEIGDLPRRYDGNTGEHFHVQCLRCGRIADVSLELVDEMKESVEKQTGYQVVGYQINFFGICPDCRKP